jgi:hypothetical protein
MRGSDDAAAFFNEVTRMRKICHFTFLAILLFTFGNGRIPAACGQSLIFGPEFFSGDGGKSLRVVRSFAVQDVNQKYILSIQSGGSSEHRAGTGTVEINGEIVVSLDVGERFEALTKPVRLRENNDIVIDGRIGAGASIVVTIMNMEDHAVTARVPPNGKEANLAGYASIVFPAGSFDSAHHVMIYATVTDSTNDLFEAHATGPRLPYEIRVNTGNKAPERDIEVDLNIPESFFSSPYQIHIFVRMHDNPDVMETHDRFFMISSSVDDVIKTVRTTLPRHAFSTRFGRDGSHEAVVTVGLMH